MDTPALASIKPEQADGPQGPAGSKNYGERMTAPWSSVSLRFLSRCAERVGRWCGFVGRHVWREGSFAAHKSAGREGHATGGVQVCGHGSPSHWQRSSL